MLLTTTVTSCSDKEEGKWEPMEWTVDNKSTETVKISTADKSSRSTITASYKGGNVDFVCTNYDYFWFSELKDDEATSMDVDYTAEVIEGNWYTIAIENNCLRFSFKERPEGSEPETAIVGVTSGDVFYQFLMVSKN